VDSTSDIKELKCAIGNLVGKYNRNSFGCDIHDFKVRIGYLKFSVTEYDTPKEYEYTSKKMSRVGKIKKIFE